MCIGNEGIFFCAGFKPMILGKTFIEKGEINLVRKLFVIISFIIIGLGGIYYQLENKPLNQSVLRLHVVAHSDRPADQVLKLQVKDAIVNMMQTEFKELDDVKQARQIAEADIPRLQKLAESVVSSEGYDYPVAVSVGEYEFPTKSYGNMVFPQGNYQAVRVVIGEGEGKNWWCVLFPPLCLVSASDQGLSLNSAQEAQLSFKCLELIPKGVKIQTSNK